MIRPYSPGDMQAVLPRIRQDHLNELAAYGSTPEENLLYGIQNGEAVTVEFCGEIVGIAGVVAVEDYLVPWSVFTEQAEKHRIPLLRNCKEWLDRYDKPMMNVVDARNLRAKRWLIWLGFEIEPAEPMGVNGELFHTYWRGYEH